MTRKRTIALLFLAPVIAVVVGALWIAWSTLSRHTRAIDDYESAVAAYMMYDVEEAKRLMTEVSREYGDLPIGALAELKTAFLVYDDGGDLDEAERRFQRYLDTHPDTVLHLPQTPEDFEYYGELQLVAWYFLGRIAEDRGQRDRAVGFFARVAEAGSRNPANFVVSDARSFIERFEREGERP